MIKLTKKRQSMEMHKSLTVDQTNLAHNQPTQTTSVSQITQASTSANSTNNINSLPSATITITNGQQQDTVATNSSINVNNSSSNTVANNSNGTANLQNSSAMIVDSPTDSSSLSKSRLFFIAFNLVFLDIFLVINKLIQKKTRL